MTGGKFAGTALLLGAATAAVMWTWSGHPAASAAVVAAWALRLVLSGWEQWKLRAALSDSSSTWHRSALVMTRLQADWNRDRFLLLLLSGGVLPVCALLLPAIAAPLLTLALLATLASQLIERRQFFTAAAGPNMPGCRPAA